MAFVRGRIYCHSCSTLKEYCKKSLDKLEELKIQILNICAQKLNFDPQNIIIQYTDQRQSHQLQPITQISDRSQQNQLQFYVGNIRNQMEVGGDQQGQNQFLAERQIEEIRQTFNRNIERNERIYRSQLDFQSKQIDQLLRRSSENEVKEEIREAKKKQKQCIKKIEFQVNQASEFVKRNRFNIQQDGLDQCFDQQNQEIKNIFKNYSNGFEQDIKEKAALKNQIMQWIKSYKKQELNLDKLKQQYQELRQKNSQIEILKEQSNNSQREFFNRQNDIKTFFLSIVQAIDQIKQNAPIQ